MTINTADISCPRCKKAGTWTPDNTFRPFCSERCKLIDLGDWAAEKHHIAGEEADPDEQEKNDDQGP